MERPDNLTEKREQFEQIDDENTFFSEEQIDTFEDNHVDEYEEVLEVLEEQDPHNPDPRIQFYSP